MGFDCVKNNISCALVNFTGFCRFRESSFNMTRGGGGLKVLKHKA